MRPTVSCAKEIATDVFRVFTGCRDRYGSCGRVNVDNHQDDGSKETTNPPAQDEWGMYDPAQAGLAAVIRRLAEAEDSAAAASSTPGSTGTK